MDGISGLSCTLVLVGLTKGNLQLEREWGMRLGDVFSELLGTGSPWAGLAMVLLLLPSGLGFFLLCPLFSPFVLLHPFINCPFITPP